MAFVYFILILERKNIELDGEILPNLYLQLREDIEKNHINIYPVLNRHDLDEEEARTTSRIRVSDYLKQPLSVIKKIIAVLLTTW